MSSVGYHEPVEELSDGLEVDTRARRKIGCGQVGKRCAPHFWRDTHGFSTLCGGGAPGERGASAPGQWRPQSARLGRKVDQPENSD